MADHKCIFIEFVVIFHIKIIPVLSMAIKLIFTNFRQNVGE